MTEASGIPAIKFKVDCQNCGGKYDAMKASWCNCLSKDRTLRCPHCDECFCKAPVADRNRFWATAPPELKERRKEHDKEKPAPFENLPPDEIRRPMVLLVDDDRLLHAIAIRIIERLGYGVAVAQNGVEGLEMAKSYRPELVLTDAMMPKLDGREMGRLIKNDPDLKNTRVVVITSLYTDSRYKYEALSQFRADEYLAKPIDARQLQDVVKRHLGERVKSEG
jgi:CheY-like chemotaxis protein